MTRYRVCSMPFARRVSFAIGSVAKSFLVTSCGSLMMVIIHYILCLRNFSQHNSSNIPARTLLQKNMLGTSHNDQPEIEIEVSGTSENAKKVTALVDSGFNVYLMLPYQDAFPLGLILKGIQSNTLADGSTSPHFVCLGAVCVDGKCINTMIDIQPANIILLRRV
jgi:predicted aspartyl protease